MEKLRGVPMPDLATVLKGVRGSDVIPILQQVARDHGGGWVLNQTTVPKKIAEKLGSLADPVRAGGTVYVDHVGNVIFPNAAPVGENA